MNITFVEKMATGLFVIWVAVILFLTVQLYTVKIENKRLKEQILNFPN